MLFRREGEKIGGKKKEKSERKDRKEGKQEREPPTHTLPIHQATTTLAKISFLAHNIDFPTLTMVETQWGD